MIKQIKFVSIPVADQNRALDFYTDKLGFTIIVRRETTLDRTARAESGDASGVVHAGRGRKTDRIVYEHVVCVRRHRQDICGAEEARRGIRRSATETTVGDLRNVQRQRGQPVCRFGAVEPGAAGTSKSELDGHYVPGIR